MTQCEDENGQCDVANPAIRISGYPHPVYIEYYCIRVRSADYPDRLSTRPVNRQMKLIQISR